GGAPGVAAPGGQGAPGVSTGGGGGGAGGGLSTAPGGPGNFGPGSPSGPPGGSPSGPYGPGYPGAPGGAAPAQPEETRDPNTAQLVPGVTWLGRASRAELVEKAKAQGLDVLVVFETIVSVVPSTGLEKNTTKLMLINVHGESVKDQQLYQTRTALTNVSFWQAKEKNKDLIEEELDALFQDKADELVKLAPLPELTAEQVQQRVDQVTASPLDNPLPTLAEFLYYHKKGLLDESGLIAAYEKVLGDAERAEQLATGSNEEREAVIAEWIPPAWTENPSEANFR
ncbi:MAG TPA: hypothetical protein PLI18_20730, partial [Pirellulaceae bacterium]|nr:hypothetical protein [Pirellulaceae bacterium]